MRFRGNKCLNMKVIFINTVLPVSRGEIHIYHRIILAKAGYSVARQTFILLDAYILKIST